MNTTQFPAPTVVYTERPSRGLSTAALVLGVVGSVIGLIPLFGIFAIACGILAVIFGVTGARKARRGGCGRGFAVSGWILGIVAITLGVIGLVIVNNALVELEQDINELEYTP